MTGQDVCELDREVCKMAPKWGTLLCVSSCSCFGSSVCVVSMNINGRVGTVSTRKKNVLKEIHDTCKCVSSLIILIQFWVKY